MHETIFGVVRHRQNMHNYKFEEDQFLIIAIIDLFYVNIIKSLCSEQLKF